MSPKYLRISASHLREDIREAKGMIRELQRGVRRDEKELGMTKRKSKTKSRRLGSPPEVHKRSAFYIAQNARSAAKRARIDIKQGNCERAITSLVAAAEYAGMSNAEASGAKGQIVRRRPLTDRVIDQLTTRVIKACIKPR